MSASTDDKHIKPTRLLDLHAFDDAEDLCVVESSDLQESKYLTLSYTWGGVEPFKLTKQNYNECSKRLDFQKLPLVCQQAISVTRKLGYRYLWIDSVCIIQDDKDDWTRESALMDVVFAGSVLTLAASTTKTCNDELYCARDPLATFAMSLHYYGLPCQVVPAFCSSPAFPPKPMDRSRHRSRGLDSRGWVYQERALSPRTVHFTGARLHWECRTHRCCESEGSRDLTMCRLFDEESPKYLLGLLTEPAVDSEVDANQKAFQPRMLWSMICSKYGSTTLTNWSDRQHAFAGLLRFLQQQVRYNISYGVCLDHGTFGLLWYAINRRQATRDAGIPTWSWMCLKPNTPGEYNVNVRHLLAAKYGFVQTEPSDAAPSITELATLDRACGAEPSVLKVYLPLTPFAKVVKNGVLKSLSHWFPITPGKTKVKSIEQSSEGFSLAGQRKFRGYLKWRAGLSALTSDRRPAISYYLRNRGLVHAGAVLRSAFTTEIDRKSNWREFNAAYASDVFCGVLFQGHNNKGYLIYYCLVLRRLTKTSSEYERVGVVVVEFEKDVIPGWPMTKIRLV